MEEEEGDHMADPLAVVVANQQQEEAMDIAGLNHPHLLLHHHHHHHHLQHQQQHQQQQQHQHQQPQPQPQPQVPQLQPQPQQQLSMEVPLSTSVGGGGGVYRGEEDSSGREYRKGNWTMEETMVLITAKKLDEERRVKGGGEKNTKAAELRWKWVENYCWRHGCQRSQNQCNDKWDNLLRDYKKVRDYELRRTTNPTTATAATSTTAAATITTPSSSSSYWDLDKHERKERGLPSNLAIKLYQALHEILDKRYLPRLLPPLPAQQGGGTLVPSSNTTGIITNRQSPLPTPSLLPLPPSLPPPLPLPLPPPQQQQHHHQQQQHRHHAEAGAVATIVVAPEPSSQPGPYSAEQSESSDSEGSEAQPSPVKRRKMRSKISRDIRNAFTKSTLELTQTILTCEDKKDKRHMDILRIEEQKIRIEETKTEISRQGIAGLIDAVNNLANSILTLASDRNVTAGD